MRYDLTTRNKIYSTMLAYEKDIEAILKVLFVSSKPYSDILKRLLVINNKDCLDMSNEDYQKVIDSMYLGDLIDKGYIKLNSKIERGTHEEIKAYLLIDIDDFRSSNVKGYRDYNIYFGIVCYNDAVQLSDYKNRPLTIAGYIDGILNSLTNNQINLGDLKSYFKSSGIGECQFLGCSNTTLNEDFCLYTLGYSCKHFSEDIQSMDKVINNA